MSDYWMGESARLQAEVELLRTEVQRLTEKVNRQAMTFKSLAGPEKYPGPFICGYSGDKDTNQMPEKLWVVPTYGVDFFYVYERTDRVVGPEY